jgi:membrane-associated phospholipid phosphatase
MRLRVSWTQFARELPCVLLLFSLLAALLTWEPEALVLAGLMLLTLLAVAVLKPLLRHSRPVGARRPGSKRQLSAAARALSGSSSVGCDDLGVGFRGRSDPYGMPSGHTAVAFAFFTYALFWTLRRKRAVEPWQRVLGYAVSVPLFVLAPVLVAFQRVYTRRHSVAQVVVGAALGIGLGVAAGLAGDRALDELRGR